MYFTDFILSFTGEETPRGDLARDLKYDIDHCRCRCKTYEGLRTRIVRLNASQTALKALHDCNTLFEHKKKPLYVFEAIMKKG